MSKSSQRLHGTMLRLLGMTNMYEGCRDDHSRSEVLRDKEGPSRNANSLVSCRVDWEDGAQRGSDQNHENGRDSKAHPAIVFVARGAIARRHGS